MRITGLFTIVVALSSGGVARADDPKPDRARVIPVQYVSKVKGDKVSGAVAFPSIRVEWASGVMEFPASVLSKIELTHDASLDSKAIHRIFTRDHGIEIVGVIREPMSVTISSPYGSFSTDWKGVRSLTFRDEAGADEHPDLVIGAGSKGPSAGDERGRPILESDHGASRKVPGIRELTGHVLGPDGEPIAGATVTPITLLPDGERAKFARTDAKGRYSIEWIGKDLPVVKPEAMRVEAPGLARCVERVQEGKATNFCLDEGSTISGHLIYHGRPLADVIVQLVASNRLMPEFLGQWQAKTDDLGRFRLENVPLEREYDLYFTMATLQNFGAIPPRHLRNAIPNRELDLGEIRVQAGHKIGGRIAFTDELPPPDGAIAYVNVGEWDSISSPVDAEGRFELRGVPSTAATVWVGFANSRSAPTGYRLSARNRSLDPMTHTNLHGRVDRDIEGLILLFEPGPEPKPSDPPAEAEIKEVDVRPLAGAEAPPQLRPGEGPIRPDSGRPSESPKD